MFIECIKGTVWFVKDKVQKIKYIEGRWCDTVNEIYLDRGGWTIVSVHPVATKNEFGIYVVMEKENAAADSPTVKTETALDFGWV